MQMLWLRLHSGTINTHACTHTRTSTHAHTHYLTKDNTTVQLKGNVQNIDSKYIINILYSPVQFTPKVSAGPLTCSVPGQK